MLLDDLKNSPTPTPLPLADADETWTANTYMVSLAADLDGDGIDEIVNVYWIDTAMELHANVLKCSSDCTGNGGSFSKVMDSKLNVYSTTKAPTDRSWFKHGITAADVDGDGKKELVIGNFGGIDVCTAAADFSFSCMNELVNAAAVNMSLATGHFDDIPGVQNDDVVVAWSDGQLGHVSIYDGTPNAFGANATTNPNHSPIDLAIQFADQTSVLSFSEAYVTAGDFDLDGRDEIILAAREAGTVHHDLVLLDDAEVFYRPFKTFRYPLGDDGGSPVIGAIIDNPQNNTFRPALKVFTKTGGVSTGATTTQLAKAIYAGEYIIDSLPNILASSTTALPSNEDVTNNVTADFMGYYETGGGGYNHAPDDVVAGDIDGSGRDSIVAMWDETNETSVNENGFTPATLASVAWDAGSNSWPRWTNFFTTTSGMAQIAQGSATDTDGSYGPGLALPNVDRDSPVVQYQGQHEELFGTPRVLAVLAAAPFFTGQNSANSQTAISFGSGSGYDAQSTIGVSAGFSIGYSAPSLFGLDEASWKLSFNASLDSISTTDAQISETVTWTAGAEDAVVFQVIPFDVYYYKVVSSPNPADLNQPLSINVPRTIETFKVPVALYNQSIVDGPTVGPDVLTHTVGVPSSYPTANVCAAATGTGSFGSTSFLVDPTSWCYAVSSTTHVGVGTGSVGFQNRADDHLLRRLEPELRRQLRDRGRRRRIHRRSLGRLPLGLPVHGGRHAELQLRRASGRPAERHARLRLRPDGPPGDAGRDVGQLSGLLGRLLGRERPVGRTKSALPVALAGRAARSAAVRHPTGRGHQQIDPLRRRLEVTANPQLPVDEDQVLAVEDLPEAGRVVGVATGRGDLLLAHPFLEAADDGGLDRLDGAGEERPGQGAGAITGGVVGQPRRGVARGVDGERHQVKVGAEIAGAVADLGHLLAQERAGLLAGGEDEVGHPDLAGELARAERLPALIGQRERRHPAEQRRGGAQTARDRAEDGEAEQQPQQRRPHEGVAGRARRRRSAGAESVGCRRAAHRLVFRRARRSVKRCPVPRHQVHTCKLAGAA